MVRASRRADGAWGRSPPGPYTVAASAFATTTSAGTPSPDPSRTPRTRPPAVSIDVTRSPVRSVTPSARHRSATTSASRRSPPGTYQDPNCCSTYGTTASAAGARRGSEPE